MTISAHDWRVISAVLEAAEVSRTERVCYEVTSALGRLLGWPVESGFYVGDGGRVGHYWNRLPDGTIVDASAGQFDPDLDDPVRVIGPDDPGQADYRAG